MDLTEWVLSLGRRPLRRELAGLRGVRIVKHLRSAAWRLPSARLPEAAHKELTQLIDQASELAEAQLRTHFRPLLNNALDAAGLVPTNLPERIAREKIVEVLLDHIGERGYFTMGELRDAISSNQLKVDEAFPLGDQLLLLNNQLSVTLDGIYRPGEIYLRWLQTLSFGFFGTPLGGFLTKYLLLPFGGAFVILAGIYFLAEEGQSLLRLVGAAPALTEEEKEHHKRQSDALGRCWRRAVRGGHARSGRVSVPGAARGRVSIGSRPRSGPAVGGLRLVLIDMPAWLVRLPLLRALWNSPPVVLFRGVLARPLLVTAVTLLVAWGLAVDDLTLGLLGGGVFLVSAVFFRLRLCAIWKKR